MSSLRRAAARTSPVVVGILAGAALAAWAPRAAADPAPASSDEQPAAASAQPTVGSVQPRREGEPVIPTRNAAREGELTAADVASDPLPGFESGRTDPGDSDSTLRVIGRGALFVPKLAAEAVLSPFRGALWLQEHYHLTDWYTRIFYNDAETIGLYPTASADSQLGITAGLHFVDHDLFGAKEDLQLQGEIGSRYRQIYSVTLASGKRLGERFGLSLDAGYEIRPHDAFYGIGNGERVAMTTAPVDPRFDSTSVESHYRQYRSRVAVMGDLRTWSKLHLRGAGAISKVDFGAPDTGTPIDQAYAPQGLVGLGGIRYGYGELELRWDDRHGASVMEPIAVHSEGSLAAGFAGLEHRLDSGPDFWRYGLDLQKFIRVAAGPRVVVLHFHGEGVTGSRSEVPFTELPKLGGSTYLRGYGTDQFRDRVAAFGSAAYEWDLSQWFSASVFTDVGRVFPALDELSLRHLRMGYGASIEAHSPEAFVMEASIGSSIDGGLFLNLAFSRVYDLDERVRRR